MGIVFIIVISGIGLAYVLYMKKTDLPGIISQRLGAVYKLVFNKYYVDEIYNFLIVQPLKNISNFVLWKFIDVKIIDGAVNGTGFLVRSTSRVLRGIQTGFVQNYALVFVLGVIALLFYVVFI